MGILEGSEYSSITAEKLLGRTLNDVEEKFVPEKLYIKGSMEIPIPGPRVSIIGSRSASQKGLEATQKITKNLVEEKMIIVSGLARGIDTSAHQTAIKIGGQTIAVIGTPLDKVYPRENAQLQEEIMRNHLVVSQFPKGYPVTARNFVLRNRTMALISDATIIVEATCETSGSRHQGWEALRLGRPLFIWKSVFDTQLQWPQEMLKYGAIPLSDPKDMFEILPSHLKMVDVFQ